MPKRNSACDKFVTKDDLTWTFPVMAVSGGSSSLVFPAGVAVGSAAVDSHSYSLSVVLARLSRWVGEEFSMLGGVGWISKLGSAGWRGSGVASWRGSLSVAGADEELA